MSNFERLLYCHDLPREIIEKIQKAQHISTSLALALPLEQMELPLEIKEIPKPEIEVLPKRKLPKKKKK